MGYYDECYEASDREHEERMLRDMRYNFERLLEKLDDDDKEFILLAMRNKTEVKVLFKLFKL